MDLFGTKRKRAIKAAIEAIQPIIGTIQHVHGLPPRFWVDDFVLGYVLTVATFVAQQTVGNLDTIEKGEVLKRTLEAVSNQNVTPRCIELFAKPTADFLKGRDNATTSLLYIYGRLKDEDNNPDVQAAKGIAFAMGHPDDRLQIGSMLMHRLFHQFVIDRFEL